MMRRILLLTLFATLTANAAKGPPSWVSEAATSAIPDYEDKPEAVVLLDEQRVGVDAAGIVTRTQRYAVKMVSRSGRDHALARALYRTNGGKVRSLRAWSISPSGKSDEYSKKLIIDAALSDSDVYNEARVKIISGRHEMDPGAVFAYEAVVEDKSVFSQCEWLFHDSVPVLRSRLTVALPAGWTAEATKYNGDNISASQDGSVYVWEARDVLPIEREWASPRLAALAPRVSVSYFPPAGQEVPFAVSFASWEAVSAWLARLNEPSVVSDAALQQKSTELGGGSELERLRAVGEFAQKINYVSVQTGLGRGGGYQPHAATEVFAKSYGDCKDKANLMRTMLKELGVDAYPVAIYSGDPNYVREDWPSPEQFNHAIIAIKVSDDIDLPAVLEHPELGRLLFFDPTDELTPLGYLPEHEQNSWALLVDPEHGGLVRAPSTPPSANRLSRRIEIDLQPTGAITAKLHDEASGQAAIDEQRLVKNYSEPRYRKLIESWIGRRLTGASIASIEHALASAAEFRLDVEFDAPSYAQSMAGRMLIFKPAIVGRRSSWNVTDEEREFPIVLSAESYNESIEARLPEGFEADEIPTPVEIETEFGRFEADWKVEDGVLRFTRALELQSGTLPPEDYGEVREFFQRVGYAASAPVVLVKQ